MSLNESLQATPRGTPEEEEEEEEEGLDSLFEMLGKFQERSMFRVTPALSGSSAVSVSVSDEEKTTASVEGTDVEGGAGTEGNAEGGGELPSLFEMLAGNRVRGGSESGGLRSERPGDQRSPAPQRKAVTGPTTTLAAAGPAADSGAGAGAGSLPDTAKMHREIVRRKEQCQREIADMEQEVEELERKIAAEHQRLGSADKYAQEQRRAIVEEAFALFEESGKAGIEYLKQHDYFKDGGTAAEIAEFLFTQGQRDLSKEEIGEYIGAHKEHNLAVLAEFVKLHEFTGQDFDQALRAFLWSFRLPGESQKIDRMMEAFAARYCSCNPGVFHSTDGGYILAFATIMLNTSLHNPAVTAKTTEEMFVSMNRGVDDGKDINPELLHNLYASIKKTPFKLPGDAEGITAMFGSAEKEGWVAKEGGSNKNWKRRWLVLKDSCIYYFKHHDDDHPCGIIPLDGVLVGLVADSSVPKGRFKRGANRSSLNMYCSYFELIGEPDGQGGHKVIKGCKTNSKGVVVQGHHNRYLFHAQDETEAREWTTAIQAAMTGRAIDDLRQKRITEKHA